MAQLKHPEDEIAKLPHPSADRTQRFAVDRLIRDQSWRIWRRRSGMEAVWEHAETGEKLKQSEVLKRIPKGKIEDAIMKENLYFGRKAREAA